LPRPSPGAPLRAELPRRHTRQGMTLDNLVKITTILPNHGDLAATREGRCKVLGDRKPASTLIVGGLANPARKIEVEGIAVA
jgi:2-iminobutanoate/2-iminopropanoate deaminase